MNFSSNEENVPKQEDYQIALLDVSLEEHVDFELDKFFISKTIDKKSDNNCSYSLNSEEIDVPKNNGTNMEWMKIGSNRKT